MDKKGFIEELRNFKNECRKHSSCEECCYDNGWNNAEMCIISTSDVPCEWEILGYGEDVYKENEKKETPQLLFTSIPKDNINHPSHYKQGKYETIQVIESITGEAFEGYLVGNVVKYVSRYKYKNGMEDLKKAMWYLNKLIEVKSNE